MYKKVISVLFVFFFTAALMAQTGDLMIQGVSPDLYVQHTVAAKENWYSVGRIYNISPKDIAPVNGTTIDKPLSIGQQIRVPLNAINFSQSESKSPDDVFVPVIHVVQEKEWMFRISSNYNKVPIKNLEKWNKINKDQAKAGMKLIVGYLKVKKDQSPLAARGTSEIKGAAPVVGEAANTGTATNSTATPAATQPIASTPVPEKTSAPVTTAEKTVAIPPVAEKQVTTVIKPAAEEKTVSSTTTAAGGYFKSLYEESGKTTNGSAGVFKSTSGWNDGKYYALMNNVSVGTIVKLSNPSTNKIVYAKVLGQLPDMKESAGFTVRVSDAAATELGSTVAKFPVEIKY